MRRGGGGREKGQGGKGKGSVMVIRGRWTARGNLCDMIETNDKEQTENAWRKSLGHRTTKVVYACGLFVGWNVVDEVRERGGWKDNKEGMSKATKV